MIDQNELAELALASLVLSDMFSPIVEFIVQNSDWRYDIGAVNNLNWCRSIENLRINIAGSIYWHARTGQWR